MVCIDDEIPFEIPAGWEWARIRNISQSYIGLTYSPTEVSPQGTIVLRSSNIKEGKLYLGDIVRVNKTIPEKLWVEKNDIIICARNGSKKLVGKSAIVQEINEPMTFGAFMAICKTPLWQFVYYFLQSDLFFAQLREVSGTTTINQLTQNSFNSFLLPIPPSGEQKKISEKLQMLLPIVEKYGEQQEALEELNNSLKQRIQKSVLQEAIQGQLVLQDSTDEPASTLLNQIRLEKQNLLKEGRLKRKDIVDSFIFKGEDNKYYEKVDGKVLDISEEIPFEIPESWAWIRLKELIRIISGTSYQKGDIARSGIRILRGGNIQDNELVLCPDDVWLPLSYTDQEKNIREGDVVIVGSTGSPTVIGKPALIKKEYDRTQIGAFLRIIRPIFSWSYEYLGLIFKTEYYREIIRSKAKGTNINNIKAEYIEEMLIPLPPLNEQKRISSQVERIIHTL